MSGPPLRRAPPSRPKAKRSPARVAGSKKAPASAAFLTVPDKPADRTPPMTATGRATRTALAVPGEGPDGPPDDADPLGGLATALADHCECSEPLRQPQPAVTVTLDEGDEDGDVVPELVRRAESPRSSVSESTLWEHVGLQAGLSVSTAAVPYPGPGAAVPNKKC